MQMLLGVTGCISFLKCTHKLCVLILGPVGDRAAFDLCYSKHCLFKQIHTTLSVEPLSAVVLGEENWNNDVISAH